MKTFVKIAIILVLILSINPLNGQVYNWSGLPAEDRHVISLNLGWDYSMNYGLGYGYQFKSRLFPIVANIEYSFPSGSNIIDDFKVKIGGQIRWIEFHNIQFTTKIYGVFRRYENDFVRLINFGSDMAAIVGYYRPKWFAAAEVGFDKAIVTHFKHSDSYEEINPLVASGWYKPSTGGNFYYGIQAGVSIRKSDINLRIGRVLTQDFKTTPMIPYYVQIGYNRKF